MIERAARCIEHAGEHFLQGCATHLRTKRSLRRNFWQHGALDIDISLWCLSFLQSHQPAVEHHRPVYDKSTLLTTSSPPFLDFLYPPRTRSFARYYHRNSGTIPSFRRRRKIYSRGYTSLTGPDQSQSLEQPSNPEAEQVTGEESADGLQGELILDRTLAEVLETQNPDDYEVAWRLFEREGRPKDHTQNLLLFLSDSDRPDDVDRCITLFEAIPVESLSSTDYWCATKAAFHNDFPGSEVINLCKEAISEGKGELCWGFAFAAFVDRLDWKGALELWKNKPSPSETDPAQPLLSAELSDMDELPERFNNLLAAIKRGKLKLDTPGVSDLVNSILYHVVSNRELLRQSSLSSILEMFGRLASMDLSAPGYYYTAIDKLLDLEPHQGMARAILLYRNFRFRLPDVRPPKRIFRRILHTLRALSVSENLEYILKEFRHFYEKPTAGAYLDSLGVYARRGDVQNAERVFEELVQDHGLSDNQRPLSSLIYAHARLGDVIGAKRRLQKLVEDYSIKPNVVLWNIILAAHSKANDLNGAISTFREMRAAGIAPDTFSYGTIMGMYARRGQADAVKSIFYAAQRDKVELKSTMVDTVIEALCNNRKYTEAENVAREALTLTPPIPVTRSWNILLWNYAFGSDVESVSRVQRQMQEFGVPFDGMTYAALMLSLVLIRDTDAARKILKRLHRSGRIHITEFHYSILMHGYMKEKNRDMVHVLYNEMVERFDDPGPGSNLAMLRTMIQRDVQRYNERGDKEYGPPIYLAHTERFLESIMEQYNLANYAAAGPQIGSRKRTLREAFPSVYYEFVIAAYGARGAFQRANELFDEYAEKQKKLGNPDAQPLQMLYVIMANYGRAGKHNWVDKCWDMALDRVKQLFKPVDASEILSPEVSTTEQPLEGTPVRVNPLYRFSLSSCISIYMESLAARSMLPTIHNMLEEVQNLGFGITTANYSLYIKLLCQSPQPAEQLRAFTVFEDHFIDNFPGWNYVRRGMLKLPEDAPAGLELLDRDFGRGRRPDMMAKNARHAYERINPEYMQPTYTTMLHLGAALIDFRMRSIVDGGMEMHVLLSKAPRTVEALTTLPYFRDKAQGILLRGREPLPDFGPPREVKTDKHRVWTGGLLGADGEQRIDTRPVEMLPPEEEEPEDDTPWWRRAEPEEEPEEDSEWGPMPEGTSEPDSETLAELLAEDAEYRKRGRPKPSKGQDVDMSHERSLPSEHEQDLQIASRLRAHRKKGQQDE